MKLNIRVFDENFNVEDIKLKKKQSIHLEDFRDVHIKNGTGKDKDQLVILLFK